MEPNWLNEQKGVPQLRGHPFWHVFSTITLETQQLLLVIHGPVQESIQTEYFFSALNTFSNQLFH
jgi:hypothetical protein